MVAMVMAAILNFYLVWLSDYSSFIKNDIANLTSEIIQWVIDHDVCKFGKDI
jgi:hypothetical protein